MTPESTGTGHTPPLSAIKGSTRPQRQAVDLAGFTRPPHCICWNQSCQECCDAITEAEEDAYIERLNDAAVKVDGKLATVVMDGDVMQVESTETIDGITIIHVETMR